MLDFNLETVSYHNVSMISHKNVPFASNRVEILLKTPLKDILGTKEVYAKGVFNELCHKYKLEQLFVFEDDTSLYVGVFINPIALIIRKLRFKYQLCIGHRFFAANATKINTAIGCSAAIILILICCFSMTTLLWIGHL